ncbi:MAG: hypothetical protein GXP35_17605 [Actinobacteria bacterium]|nr:hypothetical protein [Actinomycetota bacterium]
MLVVLVVEVEVDVLVLDVVTTGSVVVVEPGVGSVATVGVCCEVGVCWEVVVGSAAMVSSAVVSGPAVVVIACGVAGVRAGDATDVSTSAGAGEAL